MVTRVTGYLISILGGPSAICLYGVSESNAAILPPWLDGATFESFYDFLRADLFGFSFLLFNSKSLLLPAPSPLSPRSSESRLAFVIAFDEA